MFKIQWQKDCSYTLQYVEGSTKLKPEAATFLKEHKLAYRVTEQNDNYYVFKTYIDKPSGVPIETDTMWMTPKASVVSYELYQQVKNTRALKKARFGDTAQYAIVYIYRVPKFAGSLANLVIYFNDNLSCVSTNNSLYIFKVLKEGPLKISSKLNNQKPLDLKMDIRFGEKYYIKSSPRFTITAWRASLEEMKPEKAEQELLEVSQF